MEIYIHGKLILPCYQITHFDPPIKKKKVKRWGRAKLVVIHIFAQTGNAHLISVHYLAASKPLCYIPGLLLFQIPHSVYGFCGSTQLLGICEQFHNSPTPPI